MKVQETHTCEIPLNALVLDKHVQMRTSISTIAVQDYADAMSEGDKFPPIIVFGRTGLKYFVADGFHRVLAKRKLGQKTILATVYDGGKREAILYAMKANSSHGVRRSNADKQRAVETCLHDREWVKWTDTEIARRCSVSPALVGRLREHVGAARTIRTYVTSKGDIRTRTVPYRRKIDRTQQKAICPTCNRPL